MPEVTLKVKNLPAGHPALTKSGRLKRRAQRVLNSRVMRSRGITRDPDYDKTLNPVRNTELFYRIADEIELFPASYNQGAWGVELEKKKTAAACGTAFCIAGHAAHLTGWQPTEDSWDGSPNWEAVVRPKKPWTENIINVGMNELGLTTTEQVYLFHADWKPKRGVSVPTALRAIGDGLPVSEVSRKPSNTWYDNEWAQLKAEDARSDRRIRVTGKVPTYA